MTLVCLGFTILAWAAVMLFPGAFMQLFNSEPELLEACIPGMHLFFLCLVMESFQFAGQFPFVALGRSKEAIFFSTFRKILIMVLLILHLPGLGRIGCQWSVSGRNHFPCNQRKRLLPYHVSDCLEEDALR